MPTLQGTLLLPNGTPLANANIILIADRNEGANIVKGVSSEFSTNASGVYSQSVEPGLYSVKLEYQQRSRTLGKIFIDPTTNSSLEVLLASADDAETVTVTALQTFLSDTQAAADSAAQSADDAINALAENQAQLDAFIEQAQSDVDEAIVNINNSIGQIAELIDNNENRLDTFLQNIPKLNLLTGSRGVVTNAQIISEYEAAPEFLRVFNGGSWIEGEKYTYDSVTYGGTRPAVMGSIQELIQKTNRTGGDARFGAEFYTFEYMCGNSFLERHPTYNNHYLCWINDSRLIGELLSFCAWLKVISGSIINTNQVVIDRDMMLNEVITPSDGWVFTNTELQNNVGYSRRFPGWYAEPNSVIQVALPALFLGFSTHLYYVSPVPEFIQLGS